MRYISYLAVLEPLIIARVVDHESVCPGGDNRDIGRSLRSLERADILEMGLKIGLRPRGGSKVHNLSMSLARNLARPTHDGDLSVALDPPKPLDPLCERPHETCRNLADKGLELAHRPLGWEKRGEEGPLSLG